MRLEKLLENAGIECPEALRKTEITKIVTDSRMASEGCMFIAVRGHNTDGHDHIDQAVKNGAVVIVAEQMRDGCVGGAAIIKVENTRRAAALLYNEQCEYPCKSLKVIGVTGTNGKTSVCSALESIFLEAGIPCAVIGTLGCRINGKDAQLEGESLTTPTPAKLYPFLALLVSRGIRYVFMEVSSHALALERVAGVDFEYGIFTNLTRDHLDFHATMEEYFLTKARLFEKCKKRIFNIDDPYGKRLCAMYRGIFASVRGNGHANAENICTDNEGNRYTLSYNGRELDISTPALGDFSVINTMQAAIVAIEEKIEDAAIIGGLSRFFGAKGRMERIALAQAGFDVMIDFAHTPDAMEKVLMNIHAMKAPSGRIILVFGCGGDRDRGKRREMAHIASRLADFTVITSDNPRSEEPERIIADILKGIDKEKPHACIASRKEAIEYAIQLARKGDYVLLCGKGHEKYEIDAHGKHPFDEELVVRRAIEKKHRIDA